MSFLSGIFRFNLKLWRGCPIDNFNSNSIRNKKLNVVFPKDLATSKTLTGPQWKQLYRLRTRGRFVVSAIISWKNVKQNGDEMELNKEVEKKSWWKTAHWATIRWAKTILKVLKASTKNVHFSVWCRWTKAVQIRLLRRLSNQVRLKPNEKMFLFLETNIFLGEETDRILRRFSEFSIDWFTDNKREAPLKVNPSRNYYGFNGLIEHESVRESSSSGSFSFFSIPLVEMTKYWGIASDTFLDTTIHRFELRIGQCS